jgi:hypothetical protein
MPEAGRRMGHELVTAVMKLRCSTDIESWISWIKFCANLQCLSNTEVLKLFSLIWPSSLIKSVSLNTSTHNNALVFSLKDKTNEERRSASFHNFPDRNEYSYGLCLVFVVRLLVDHAMKNTPPSSSRELLPLSSFPHHNTFLRHSTIPLSSAEHQRRRRR